MFQYYTVLLGVEKGTAGGNGVSRDCDDVVKVAA
jgi:hypothetical protein